MVNKLLAGSYEPNRAEL